VGTFGASGKKRASSRPSRSSATVSSIRAVPHTGSNCRKAASFSQSARRTHAVESTR
jgi:hypothetical protein